MADDDGETDGEDGDDGENVEWRHGDPDERPVMSLRGAGSTDWMADARDVDAGGESGDTDDRPSYFERRKRRLKDELRHSDLTPDEAEHRYRARLESIRQIEAGMPVVLKSDGKLTAAGRERERRLREENE